MEYVISRTTRCRKSSAIVFGQKIAAVKSYRQLRGTSLKEAEEFVNNDGRLRSRTPEEFQKGSGAGGCLGVRLLALAIFAAIGCCF